MGKYLIDCNKDVVYFKYSHPFEILRDLKVDLQSRCCNFEMQHCYFWGWYQK